MSANGVKNFIAAVDLVFPAPQYGGDKNRQAGWYALHTSELGHYPDDVLAAVGKRIVRETMPEDGHSRFFPSIARIRELCEQTMESKRALEMPLLAGAKGPPEYGPERVALARDLMKTPLGKQAAKDGWAPAMLDFCMKNMKAPSGAEIEACKAKDREFRNEHERCLKGEREFGGAWAKYAESMVRKAKELMGDAA